MSSMYSETTIHTRHRAGMYGSDPARIEVEEGVFEVVKTNKIDVDEITLKHNESQTVEVTESLLIPSATPVAPTPGMIRYDEAAKMVMAYDGDDWNYIGDDTGDISIINNRLDGHDSEIGELRDDMTEVKKVTDEFDVIEDGTSDNTLALSTSFAISNPTLPSRGSVSFIDPEHNAELVISSPELESDKQIRQVMVSDFSSMIDMSYIKDVGVATARVMADGENNEFSILTRSGSSLIPRLSIDSSRLSINGAFGLPDVPGDSQGYLRRLANGNVEVSEIEPDPRIDDHETRVVALENDMVHPKQITSHISEYNDNKIDPVSGTEVLLHDLPISMNHMMLGHGTRPIHVSNNIPAIDNMYIDLLNNHGGVTLNIGNTVDKAFSIVTDETSNTLTLRDSDTTINVEGNDRVQISATDKSMTLWNDTTTIQGDTTIDNVKVTTSLKVPDYDEGANTTDIENGSIVYDADKGMLRVRHNDKWIYVGTNIMESSIRVLVNTKIEEPPYLASFRRDVSPTIDDVYKITLRNYAIYDTSKLIHANNNTFTYSYDGTDHVYTLPIGSFTGHELAGEMNAILEPAHDVTVVYDFDLGLFTFSRPYTVNDPVFTISVPAGSTLARVLGFDSDMVTATINDPTQYYTSERVAQLSTTPYYMVVLTNIPSMNGDTSTPHHFIINNNVEGTYLNTPANAPLSDSVSFSNMSVSYLDIEIRDQYYELVDTGGVPFMLEFDIVHE